MPASARPLAFACILIAASTLSACEGCTELFTGSPPPSPRGDGGTADGGEVDAGPPPTFAIRGTVEGLTGEGLVLGLYVDWSWDPAERLTVMENGPFVFNTRAFARQTLYFQIESQPAQQVCHLSAEVSTVSIYDEQSLEVKCSPAVTVGGNVSGLPPNATVTLDLFEAWRTGWAWDSLSAGNGPFTFSQPIASDVGFVVGISQQPPDRLCLITPNTPRAAPTASVTDLEVRCECGGVEAVENANCQGSFVAVTAGRNHSCGIRTGGSLWCWGLNDKGQSGDASRWYQSTPIQIPAQTSWTSVTVGSNYTCGIQADGTLWCWGANENGQLGHSQSTENTPVQIGTESTWSSVTAGSAHTCGIQTDGTLWCWGANGDGQLGNGTTIRRTRPTQVDASSNWSAVTLGESHTCALRSDGTLWCWGANESGELGDGTSFSRKSPVQVRTGATWTQVAAGAFHTCGLQTDNSLWCWGSNEYGQVIDDIEFVYRAPKRVGLNATWSAVTTGTAHTCGIRSGGSLWCWGSNGAGQLGNKASNGPLAAMRVPGSALWSTVEAGVAHTCGRLMTGVLWCWGSNENYQLGDGTHEIRNSPVAVLEP